MPIRAHRSIENLSKCLNPNFQTLQRPIKVLESRLSIFSRHLYRHPATLTISVTPTSDHSDIRLLWLYRPLHPYQLLRLYRSLRLYRLFCQHTADDKALDFVCPFIDLGNLGIAHVAFDRIIFRVTITAKYLDGFSRDTHRGIPGK